MSFIFSKITKPDYKVLLLISVFVVIVPENIVYPSLLSLYDSYYTDKRCVVTLGRHYWIREVL